MICRKIVRLNPKRKHTKTRKVDVYNKASEVYNELLEIYFDKYNDFSGAKRKKMDPKCHPAHLILDAYDYTECFKEKD